MNLAETDRLKIAIPTKGRLREPTIELLQKAGYNFRTVNRNLYSTCTNADIVFIFVRSEDIPVLVDSGVVDLGITGSDLVLEREADVTQVLALGYGRCRLCVAVREEMPEGGLDEFRGRTIATSFPTLTGNFFREHGVDVRCLEMKGSVEIMIGLSLAHAIVDIVETGDSLRDNNLKIYHEIGRYETVLIANNKIADSPAVTHIKRRIEGIIVASQYTMLEYNIRDNLLKEAEKITPGFEAPTVSRLDEEGWMAVKVMVKKSEAVNAMDRLETLGATAIIETEVKNCRL